MEKNLTTSETLVVENIPKVNLEKTLQHSLPTSTINSSMTVINREQTKDEILATNVWEDNKRGLPAIESHQDVTSAVEGNSSTSDDNEIQWGKRNKLEEKEDISIM